MKLINVFFLTCLASVIAAENRRGLNDLSELKI